LLAKSYTHTNKKLSRILFYSLFDESLVYPKIEVGDERGLAFE
jgi:hypothetical protein